jgi:predicted nucleic-acid-binding Zn-ribbon protein
MRLRWNSFDKEEVKKHQTRGFIIQGYVEHEDDLPLFGFKNEKYCDGCDVFGGYVLQQIDSGEKLLLCEHCLREKEQNGLKVLDWDFIVITQDEHFLLALCRMCRRGTKISKMIEEAEEYIKDWRYEHIKNCPNDNYSFNLYSPFEKFMLNEVGDYEEYAFWCRCGYTELYAIPPMYNDDRILDYLINSHGCKM